MLLSAELQAWVDDYNAYDEEATNMAIRTSNNTGSLSLCPEGMHLARCVRVIDCGTQRDAKFGKEKRLAYLFWEIPALTRDDGSPQLVAKRYNLSHNEKANLRLDLQSWYGTTFDTKQLDDAGGFDLTKLIGRPALVNVVHSDDGQFANVVSVNPLPAGMECPPQVSESLVFELEPYDPIKFSLLSERMQEQIKGSAEWQALNNGHQRGNGAGRDGIVTQPAAPAQPPQDLPYATPKPTPSRQVMPPVSPGQPAGKFDDMADDIPF